MKLFGMGALGPDIVSPDDYNLAGDLGFACVASGLGTTYTAARAMAMLATWALANAVEYRSDDQSLLRGIQESFLPMLELCYGWDEHIPYPSAMVAAVHLLGSRARIVHLGRCRVSRVQSQGLVAITNDHDLEHERDPQAALKYDGYGEYRPFVPEQGPRRPTRSLGTDSAQEFTDIDVNEGDELLLASASLQDHLTSEIVTSLCQMNRSLIDRAIDLWEHAIRLDKPFAFVLVRVVKDEAPMMLRTAGSYQPSEKLLPRRDGPPPEHLDVFPGPDEEWEKEICAVMKTWSPAQLSQQLQSLAELCPRDQVVPVLIRALQWSLRSLSTRWSEPQQPIDALVKALEQTKTLEDWDADKRKIKEHLIEAINDVMGDWASCQATDKLDTAVDRLYDWQYAPEEIEGGLFVQLQELVIAEGYWDWDELRAEADLDIGGSPDDYWSRKIVRENQEARARAAFLRILGEFVEPGRAAAAP